MSPKPKDPVAPSATLTAGTSHSTYQQALTWQNVLLQLGLKLLEKGVHVYHHGSCCCRRHRGGFAYSVDRPVPKRRIRNMLDVNCTNEEKVHVHVAPVTSTGRPSVLDGPIVVAVQSGEGTFAVDGDGKGFFAISADTPGDTVYVVSADADVGEGVETISDIVTLHVAGAKAANLGVTADAPVAKP